LGISVRPTGRRFGIYSAVNTTYIGVVIQLYTFPGNRHCYAVNKILIQNLCR
jgi:hypothetical protein